MTRTPFAAKRLQREHLLGSLGRGVHRQRPLFGVFRERQALIRHAVRIAPHSPPPTRPGRARPPAFARGPHRAIGRPRRRSPRWRPRDRRSTGTGHRADARQMKDRVRRRDIRERAGHHRCAPDITQTPNLTAACSSVDSNAVAAVGSIGVSPVTSWPASSNARTSHCPTNRGGPGDERPHQTTPVRPAAIAATRRRGGGAPGLPPPFGAPYTRCGTHLRRPLQLHAGLGRIRHQHIRPRPAACELQAVLQQIRSLCSRSPTASNAASQSWRTDQVCPVPTT